MASQLSSIRIPEEIIAQYEAVAQATGRSRNALLVDALRDAIASEAWFVAAVQRGIAAADAGDFVPEAEMEALWDELCQ
jgi:predicted transcriptional regulator